MHETHFVDHAIEGSAPHFSSHKSITHGLPDLALVTRRLKACSWQGTVQKLAGGAMLYGSGCALQKVHSEDMQSIATTLGGPMGHNNQLTNQHRASPPSLEAHQS